MVRCLNINGLYGNSRSKIMETMASMRTDAVCPQASDQTLHYLFAFS